MAPSSSRLSTIAPGAPAAVESSRKGRDDWRLLWQPIPGSLAYPVALTLALLFIAQLYPLGFLLGDAGFLETGDAAQHVSGWWFFASDDWHFPLLHTDRLNHPRGTSIAFTDSIPLAALLFKPLVAWLPRHFHYIGLWHAVAFTSQALGAAFLLRALNIRHILGTIAAVGLALLWPALLGRIGHAALMTHGLLLLALGFYFMGRRRVWSADNTTCAFLLLSIAALLIHPYLVAMCLALLVAFLVDLGIANGRERWGWGSQALRLATVMAIGVGVASLCGYFGATTSTVTEGFGRYSMNLASPFCGGRILNCITDGNGSQGEGANFFGAGVWLLLLIVMLQPRTRGLSLRRFPALATVLLLLALYAVSNVVYLGAQRLFSYPLPDFLTPLTGTFRASGRFFWPVGYAVLFFALASLLRKPSAWATAAIVAALGVQWLDLQPYRDTLAAAASRPVAHPWQAWETLMAGVTQLDVYPGYTCSDDDPQFYLRLQQVAGFYGARMNTAYVARPNTDCQPLQGDPAGHPRPQHLYIMSARALDKDPLAAPSVLRQLAARDACFMWQAALICRPGTSAATWVAALPGARAATLTQRVVWPASRLGTVVGRLVDGRLVDRRQPVHDGPLASAQSAAAQPGPPGQPVTPASPRPIAPPIPPIPTGVLSFGPYATLPPGHYRWQITYASQARASTDVATWDVFLNGGTQKPQRLVNGSLEGTLGLEKTIEGLFSVEGGNVVAEIRTFSMPTEDMALISVAVERLD